MHWFTKRLGQNHLFGLLLMSFLQGISVRLSSQVLPFSFATWSHKHRTGSAEWLWEGREHPRSILLTHLRPDSSHPEASVFDVAVGCWCDDYLYRQYSYIIISCCRLLNVLNASFIPELALFHRLGTRIQEQECPPAKQRLVSRLGIPKWCWVTHPPGLADPHSLPS